MTDFLWHAVSDKEKEGIKKEAKAIMDSFSKKLGKVPTGKLKESFIERAEGERVEGEGREGSPEFRKAMLENAPNKNDDSIIAEKKKW
jgi:Asp-tRNA(Asn)/Glu-tRNA(Gln) amidotransferase C subunit